MSDTQFEISKDQETALLTYATTAQQLLINQFSLRSHLELVDRAYQRENNWTEAQIKTRLANNSGQLSQKFIQDVTVPIVMPQVESALAYAANVFLTGYPMFGVSAAPDQEDAALQLEAIIAENSITAAWARQFIMFFRDGFKYNLHGLELDWQQRTNWGIENDPSSPNGAKAKKILWQGNVIKRLDLYNTFFDPRCHPAEIHEKGEFAGYIEIMSRVMMKKWLNDLYPSVSKETIVRALESSPAAGTATSSMAPFAYYQPLINPVPLMDRQNIQGFDWLSWAYNTTPGAQGIKYSNVYQRTKLYARIIPADFDLRVPEKNTPQVWKFNIINGQVILTAERQTNIHNFIPMFFGQPIEDGLDYQTKSFADNSIDMQNTATSMLSGYMASKRKLVGDRVIYDPLRISKKDINDSNPAAKIPVRASAYGKPPSEAVYAFPYRDEQTTSLLQGVQTIIAYSDKINGQNPAQQGQFVKGNKTLHEYQDTMGHANDTNHLMALMAEFQVMVPLKEGLKLNILQYQQETTIQNPNSGTTQKINPVDLRKASVMFKVSDGELPKDKLMSTDEWQTVVQAMMSSPTVAAGYNLAPMISYLFKIQADLDLAPFQKSALQLQFEQASQQWQQVAMEAIKAGQQPLPQPQMPPALIQELQAKQQTGGVGPSPTAASLAATQG